MGVFLQVLMLLAAILLFRVSELKQEEQPPKDLLLPDLRLSPPEQLYIDSADSVKKIRFSTSFINQGKGSLEVLGRHDLDRQKTRATQKILKNDGSVFDHEIGEFIFHPGHEHWHIENYALFELWSLKEDKKPDKMLATTSKMSFCLWDENSYDPGLENASQVQKYVGCNNEIQGVSVGWSDTYDAATEGQELDISNVPDGTYLVRSAVNPDKKILESDYNNNEVIIYINIDGDNLLI